MARMGESKHLKRHAAPPLKVPRKLATWLVKPQPGPHSAVRSVPLGVLLRDYLKLVGNLREAKKVLKEGRVLVDGRVVREHKFPTGLMDVVSFPSAGLYYRILLDNHERPFPKQIPEEESSFKLCRIERKKMIKGGKIQLCTHDGRTFIFDGQVDHKIGDSLKISLPEQKVLDVIKLERGALVYVSGGKNVSRVGRVVEVRRLGMGRTSVVLRSDSEEFETIQQYVFPIGRETPLISLPEQ